MYAFAYYLVISFPSKLKLLASVISTSTIFPIYSFEPSILTSLLFSVYPINLDESFLAYTIDTKDVEKCVINYSSKSPENICMNVKDKYILKEGDIIIANIPSTSTAHVGYASKLDSDYPIVIKKNFIVLRNISDDYNPLFVAEYLETIGIKKFYVEKNKDASYAMVKEDIESIDIPNVSKEDQDRCVSLLNPLNERDRLYKELLVNDSKIKECLLQEVINGDK